MAVLLPLLGCDGPSGLQLFLNPLSVLEVELVPAADTLVPGDHVPVTILVRNPTSVPIQFVKSGCPTIGFDVILPNGDVWPAGFERGFALGCSDVYETWTVAPHDTLVVQDGWGGVQGPPGTYQLRPFVDAEEGRREGKATRIALLPWTVARFVHTGPLPPLDFVVGGRRPAKAVAPGLYSTMGVVPAGPQRVEIRHYIDDALIGASEITFREGVTHTVALRVSPDGLEPIEVTDTAVATAPSEGRLRVVHLAANAPPLDVFLVRPESPDPVPLMAPFPYGTASPYLSSAPGKWTVIVKAQGGAETLLRTAPIPILG
ncbi:MAG: DUF4397 domain-containing protein, partial [Gemmatimonadota bacterium]|nr:DUF4397 domain-containing protein [Gemmatimonadota bacterium]